jgi:polyphosphate kinase
MKKMDVFFDRELSWVAFNGRVLREAADPLVPLYERLKFLAIYSSNLDEFFRVRVAGIRSLISLGRKKRSQLEIDPAALLDELYIAVDRQQKEFGNHFSACLADLRSRGVFLLQEDDLSEARMIFLRKYFREQVQPFIQPLILRRKCKETFLRNRVLYLVTELRSLHGDGRSVVGRVTIPTEFLTRFVTLPKEEGNIGIMFLDDVVRMNLHLVFEDYEVMHAFAVKINRDADLRIEDDFTGDLVKKIRQALASRETGAPARFLYDPAMPATLLKRVRRFYGLDKEDLFPGGRYHNFHDLFSFPNPLGGDVLDVPLPPLQYLPFERASSMFDAVETRDHILHFPYHRFDPVIRFLEEAAEDAEVEYIAITLYRIATNSRIAEALIKAGQAGKKIRVFMEIKARFDEETNIFWSERLKKAGAEVLYSIPGLKVHAKMYLIVRRENRKQRLYAYLGTGNFNEKTADLYCDHGCFTTAKKLTREVAALFDILSKIRVGYEFKYLAVAQFNMRSEINRLIDVEIGNARDGREARILMKLNSLEDPNIIRRLYRASRAGVIVHLIVRGICCLVPGVEGLSENIRVVSIIDRFLEHARVCIFHNGGAEVIYLGSADMMRRNLNRRIEVMFPINDPVLRTELRMIIDLQLRDTVKTRIINEAQDNSEVPDPHPRLQAQPEIWRFLAGKECNALPDAQ